MMRCFLIIAFILSVLQVAGQRMQGAFGQAHEDGLLFGIEGHASLASRQISNQFLGGLAFSDQLSAEVIGNQLDKLAAQNRIGGDLKYGVHARWQPEGRAMSWWVGASDQLHASGELPPDLLRLVFQGNGQSKGEELNLDNTELSYLRFQKIGVGAEWNFNLGSQVGLMVSFVNGEQWLRLRGESGGLYTSERADTLRAFWQGSFATSDTSRTGFGSHNGGGVSFDAFWSQRVTTSAGIWDVGVRLNDIGWIQWHPTALQYSIDTSVVYTGLELSSGESGLGLNNEELVSEAEAALSSFNRTKTEDIWLPGWVQVYAQQRRDNQGVEWGGGAVWRLATAAATYVWAGSSYRFSSAFVAGGEVGYGGFGGVQLAISSSYEGEHFSARMRLGSIESFLLPRVQSGALLSIGINYRI